jgi:hypothetical protein
MDVPVRTAQLERTRAVKISEIDKIFFIETPFCENDNKN